MATIDSDFRIKHGIQVAGNAVVAGNTNLQGTNNQVGTITSGTWNATAISRQYGGFGQNTTGLSGYVFFNGAVTTASPTIPASAITGALSSATISWTQVTSKPTTLSGYGITDAATSASLTTHATDATLHLTTAQNTLLDGLSASLTSAEVNRLVGVTAPIQTQLDARLPLAGGTMTGSITMSSGSTITGIPTPTTSTEAANKAYVDALAGTSTTFAGDATGSGLVGSTINLTLASSGVTAGTYRSVTVTGKGLVTAGTNPTTLAGYGITDAQPLDADLTAIAGIAATTGLLRKTAANTWSLDTNAYITGNQSITLSGDATGTGTTAISLTLANSGVTAGTYRSVTVDAKGRVTAGTNPTTLAGYGITDAVSANTAITAGTATKITYDARGLVTSGTTLVAADIPALDTARITTGTFAADRMPAFTGDATSTVGTTSLTLANSGVTAGTYGSSTNIPQIAVDAKGRITSASDVAVSIPSGSLTFTGDVTGTGSTGSSTTLTLANSGVTAGTYRAVTVDAKGRVTGGSNPTTLAGHGITDGVNKGGDTMTGQLNARTSTGNTSVATSTGAFELRGDSTVGATMSFHRVGVYAVNMGLDNDNVFRIGGWSAAASRLQMDMSGNLTMAGDVAAFSDIRLKDDIQEIPDAIAKVQQLRGVTYVRKDSGLRQTGVIAQEVQQVLPEAVHESGEYLSVAYGNMVGLLIEAIKAQQDEITELKQAVRQLQQTSKNGE